jgi:orotidine-5'-phosphate decarboxylase
VVGGTIGPAARELGIDLDAVRGALLSPGFGAQGAGPAQLTEVFAQAADRVLVSVSRGLLGAGPEVSNLALAAKKLASAYR